MTEGLGRHDFWISHSTRSGKELALPDTEKLVVVIINEAPLSRKKRGCQIYLAGSIFPE